jgi:hypothetical protein
MILKDVYVVGRDPETGHGVELFYDTLKLPGRLKDGKKT